MRIEVLLGLLALHAVNGLTSNPVGDIRDRTGSVHQRSSSSSRGKHGEITSLPGYSGQLRSRQFGGYITVDKAHDRNLYYYMVESEGSAAGDPVVLWLNGGPGCSSFDGLIYEHGPFLWGLDDPACARAGVVLRDNPHSWSRAATMVYLDSPSAVGLSYSGVRADYSTNDTATAADSNAFLRGFFRRYPHLAGNDFYISGESYAGIYVPMLARAVVEGNRRGQKPHINIKGYLVGNGCTDPHFDGNAQVPFALGKSLISSSLYSRAHEACGGKFYDAPSGSRCGSLLNQVWADLAGLNLYNVLEECHHSQHFTPATDAAQADSSGSSGSSLAALMAQPGQRTWPLTGVVRQGAQLRHWGQLLRHNPPCTQTREADLWLNDPEVRKALHAAPLEVTGPWTICSDRISYTADAGSMLPIHKQLTRERGLRALIYSGDHDLCVPHTGSEAWTAAIHRKKKPAPAAAARKADDFADEEEAENAAAGVVAPWQPWYNSGAPAQVAGYVVEYNSGLTYATVKGAGHMVPQTRPVEALDMFTRFINRQPLQPEAK
ncbi:peptidase S10, serine carboxypeptidase [Scenedesmus sp. NREL 46B-D3]|nr:peptidase S10, serine carboxypeptidase [Scenedesmus sp. NREL 46B-D3]